MDKGDKYYTPELSEFCVGFEYEYLNHFGKDFGKYTTEIVDNDAGFFHLSNLLVTGTIRVKYLDQQDIEECGFGLKRRLINTKKIHYRGILFGNENYNIMLYLDSSIKITTSYGDTLFQGIIKNKTEFKKLLTQLGIK